MTDPASNQPQGNRRDPVVAVFVSVGLLFIVYLMAMPADITWGDGPELAASAWILGIPHPTGYPLYMVLMHAIQQVPLGTIAFRSHLFSVLCSCGALLILGLLLLKVSESITGKIRPAAAAFSLLALGTTQVFWDQAIHTEVYALFGLLMCLMLNSLPRLANDWAPSVGLFAAIGLSLVHHRLAVFAIAFSLLYWGWILLRHHDRLLPPGQRARRTGMALGAMILPLAFLLYLPLRAWGDPAINWYDPHTFERFYALISGELYQDILTNGWLLWTTRFSLTRLLFLLMIPLACYSLFALVILFGIVVITKHRHLLWGGMTLLAFVYLAFLMLYTVGDWYVFLYPVLILLTIPLCAGLSVILQKIEEASVRPAIAAICLLGLGLASLLPALTPFDREKGILQVPVWQAPFPLSLQTLTSRFQPDTRALDYATSAWNVIPEGSAVLIGLHEPTSDNELHPLLYQQVVEQRGRDCVLISAGFLFLDWYRAQVADRTGLSLAATENRRYTSRDESFRALREDVVNPLLREKRVVTTSLGLRGSLHPSWRTTIDTTRLGGDRVDLRPVGFSYRTFIPGGYVTELHHNGNQRE